MIIALASARSCMAALLQGANIAYQEHEALSATTAMALVRSDVGLAQRHANAPAREYREKPSNLCVRLQMGQFTFIQFLDARRLAAGFPR